MAFEEENTVRTEIELLKRDVSSMATVIDKLDVTIDKLTEVSNGLNRMITVHEQQITKNEQADRELFTLIEERRKEASENYEILHKRINTVKEETEEKIRVSNDSVMKELKILREHQEEHHDFMHNRMVSLEKWKWFVIGLATAAGFIIAQIPAFKSLLG